MYRRNEFSEKEPAQVLILNYVYENIGYEDEFMDGLFFDLENGQIVSPNPYSFESKTSFFCEGFSVFAMSAELNESMISPESAFIKST